MNFPLLVSEPSTLATFIGYGSGVAGVWAFAFVFMAGLFSVLCFGFGFCRGVLGVQVVLGSEHFQN